MLFFIQLRSIFHSLGTFKLQQKSLKNVSGQNISEVRTFKVCGLLSGRHCANLLSNDHFSLMRRDRENKQSHKFDPVAQLQEQGETKSEITWMDYAVVVYLCFLSVA